MTLFLAGAGTDAAAASWNKNSLFITQRAATRQILDYIGVDSALPHISPARGQPLRDECDAQMGDERPGEPNMDVTAQPIPDYEVDQRVSW
jgi:hypothetical protein